MKHKSFAKHLLSVCICAALVLVCLLSNIVNAQAATVEDLTYEIYNGEVTITDCSEDVSGHFNIPDTIEGYPVTIIDHHAFAHCSDLTSVTIPDSVTYIFDYAFTSCSFMTSVMIPDGVTLIGDHAFYNCRNLTSVNIPDSVTSIGDYAFQGCIGLQSITIPGGATYIGSDAFYDCSRLNHVAYTGTESQWNSISIGNYNSNSTITSATRHYETAFIKEETCTGYNIYCPVCDEIVGKEKVGNGSHSVSNGVCTICGEKLISIENQPYTKIVKDNTTAQFTVKASGTGLVYQWQYKNPSGSWKNAKATGNTTNTLSVPASVSRSGYQYRCVVTDSNGNKINSKAVYLYVLGIKTQPASKIVKADTTAKFTVKATGKGLSYQWQYKTSSTGSWKNVSAASGKTASYSLTAAVRHNGYQYRCRITDSAGNKVYTKVVTLYVLGIKTQPVSKTVVDGKTAKFTVTATGSSLKYQWQYRTSSSGSWKTAKATGNTTKTLSVPASVSHHGYQYRCKITDSAGNVIYTKAVSLYVLGIKTQPVNKTVKAGATAKFTVKATGKGLTYQWQYKTSSTSSWKNVSAASGKTANYSLTAAARHNGYRYRCKITDSAGNVIYTNTVKLTVK